MIKIKNLKDAIYVASKIKEGNSVYTGESKLFSVDGYDRYGIQTISEENKLSLQDIINVLYKDRKKINKFYERGGMHDLFQR